VLPAWKRQLRLQLKELEEVVEGVEIVEEGLWTFLGLSQPNLLRSLGGI
jgi:hypothetical protein